MQQSVIKAKTSFFIFNIFYSTNHRSLEIREFFLATQYHDSSDVVIKWYQILFSTVDASLKTSADSAITRRRRPQNDILLLSLI